LWYPWPDPDEVKATGTALDVSFLLDAPAGKHGYLRANGENLFFTDNTPARFWGANISGSANFLDYPQIDKLVNRMARAGINLARLISMDGDFANPNIFGNGASTLTLNGPNMDRFCYLWAALKARGIHIYLELNDYRTIKTADGVSYSYKGSAVTFTGRMSLYGQYDPKLIALQKSYANALLTYPNPYLPGNPTLAEDPAVVMVAMDNENSLTHYGTEFFNTDISFGYYKDLLKDKFNAWLRAKYGSDRRALANEWSATGTVGLQDTEDQSANDGVMDVGTVEIPVDYLSGTKNFSPKRREDTLHFLADTEKAFRADMYSYLRGIGVKGLITGGGSPSYRDVAQLHVAAEVTDFVSKHAYWGHPLAGTALTYTAGTTPREQISQISDSVGGKFAEFGKRKVFGRPLVISEYNNAEPNQYVSEATLLMSSYADLQNWHPILYNFHDGPGAITPQLMSVFTVYNHPVRQAMLPGSALIFHRHDVAPANGMYLIPQNRFLSRRVGHPAWV
jgi:hypothetical protein